MKSIAGYLLATVISLALMSGTRAARLQQATAAIDALLVADQQW